MKYALPAITLTSSFGTMAFSMIIATTTMEFTGEEVMTQCLTMGPYLLGLGVGSALSDKVSDSSQLNWLWKLEWLSVILLPIVPLLQLALIFLFINLSPAGITLDGKAALIFLLSLASTLGFGAGLLGGAQLPLILKQNVGWPKEWILAINYLGPLVAGLSVVAMSGLALSVSLQIFIIGLTQLLGLALLCIYLKEKERRVSLLAFPLFILGLCLMLTPQVEFLTLKSSYMKTKISWSDLLHPGSFFNLLKKFGSVERIRTPYQTIDFFIEPPHLEYSIPGNGTLYLNRRPQFDLFSVNVYHETMIFAALNLARTSPKRVLILGGGDGILLSKMKDIPSIQDVVMVELDEVMLKWSRENGAISQLNERVLEFPPKYAQIIAGDAVSYLRHFDGKKKYDLILVDFPFPNGPDLAKLYSIEFYRLVMRALEPTGLLVLDMPLYLDPQDSLSAESVVIIKTLQASGFASRLLFGPAASFAALSPENRVLKFDYQRFPENMSVSTAQNLVAPFNDENLSREFWKTVPVNTMFWQKGL